MAQQQQNIHVSAPGFFGLNTQDSPIGLGMEYAGQADNCVIDKFGRISSRKGFTGITTNPSILAGAVLVSGFDFIDDNGDEHLLCAGGDAIYVQKPGETDLTLLVAPNPIVGDHWQFCQLNGVCYMVQAGNAPLKYSDQTTPGTFILEVWTENPSDIEVLVEDPGYPNTITAGYGRIFCGAFDNDDSVLTWSNLLDGDGYTTAVDPGSDSGYFDLEEYWPFGHDETVAIRVHNNFLIAWGRESILLYNIPETGPVEAYLADTVEGIGCAARDSIQPIGTDLFFLDDSGVRSFSRTIQEKSIPIGDISRNVRDDVEALLRGTVDPLKRIKSVYDPDAALYAVAFPAADGTTASWYVFDTRRALEGGALRPTFWPDSLVVSALRARDDNAFYVGQYGIHDYVDGGDNYISNEGTGERTVFNIPMLYRTHPQTFEDPVALKFPKQVDITTLGGREFDICLDWVYDFQTEFSGFCRSVKRGEIWEYNTEGTEYTVAEFGNSEFANISIEQYNVWGNGRNVMYRIQADLAYEPLSIQEINVQALRGRII